MVKILSHVGEIQKVIAEEKALGKTIGFVPTMGALHRGHISLIETCRAKNDITVCSIFVNPTQFNNKEDFRLYPRHIEHDSKMLEAAGCDVLFLPTEAEIYPNESYKNVGFDGGEIAKRLEGAHRPGHFAGVVAVVKRLFEIVQPHNAYFGQKDYQQYLVINELVKHFKLPVYIEMCPTLREAGGLAMSSRNQRLTPEQRKTASILNKTIYKVRQKLLAGGSDFNVLRTDAVKEIEADGNFTVDYFDICSAKDLRPAEQAPANEQLIICTAATIGGIRLIDNMLV